MKNITSKVVITLALSLVFSLSAFAQNKSEKVEFSRDVVVIGTVVKKGKYNVNYDEKNNEMTILRGSKVIAKAPAHLTNRAKKAENTELFVSNKDNNTVLRSITLAGDNQSIVVTEGEVQAVSPQ